MQALRPKLWAPLVLVLGGAGAFAASQGAPVEAADHNDPPNRVHSTAFGMPRAATDDGAADIADLYVWNNGTGSSQHTVIALSFDGPNPATPAFDLPCDPDVLYQIHITADAICPTQIDDGGGTLVTCTGQSAAEPCGHIMPATTPITCAPIFTDMHTINVRFAQVGGSTSDCYVQAEFAADTGLTPIAANPVVAMLEDDTVSSGGVQLYAGLRDDSFFFDLQGFQDVLAGTHMLSSIHMDRDSFAGMNTPVIVVEFPTSALTRNTHAIGSATGYRVWASTSRFN